MHTAMGCWSLQMFGLHSLSFSFFSQRKLLLILSSTRALNNSLLSSILLPVRYLQTMIIFCSILFSQLYKFSLLFLPSSSGLYTTISISFIQLSLHMPRHFILGGKKSIEIRVVCNIPLVAHYGFVLWNYYVFGYTQTSKTRSCFSCK